MRTHKDFLAISLELECADLGVTIPATLQVDFTYHPLCKGASEYLGGPPIEPDEPSHVEIERVHLRVDGDSVEPAIFKLTEYDEAAVQLACLNHAEEA